MIESSQTYTRRDISISMLAANGYSLLTTGPILILVGLLYGARWGFAQPFAQIIDLFKAPGRLLKADLLFLVIFTVGVLVHELIHGVSWMLAGRKHWSNIQFGFQASTLTPYAHIRQPLPAAAYRLGTLMPGLLTGLLPALLGVITGNLGVTLMGGVFILAAGGDLTIFLLLRSVPGAQLVEDHPTRAGCYVLEPAAPPAQD